MAQLPKIILSQTIERLLIMTLQNYSTNRKVLFAFPLLVTFTSLFLVASPARADRRDVRQEIRRAIRSEIRDDRRDDLRESICRNDRWESRRNRWEKQRKCERAERIDQFRDATRRGRNIRRIRSEIRR